MSTSSLLGLIKTRCWRANGRDNKLLFVVVRASKGTRTKEFKLNGLVYVCARRESPEESTEEEAEHTLTLPQTLLPLWIS